MSAFNEKTIVLITGQPKAGTTSLFHWLEQHPKIGAGKVKELRFFLDSDYPLQSIARYNGENLQTYPTLFKDNDRPVLLDASPDYMGCETPLTLPNLHPNTKAIFIVRDPAERMKSAYRYFQSLGRVPKTMSFDDYVAKQHNEGVTSTTAVQYRALDYCRAEHYIQLWREAYRDNFLVLDFTSLVSEPQKVMNQVYEFIGIETVSIQNTDQKNKTQVSRSPKLFKLYTNIRRAIVKRTIQHPFIFKVLRSAGPFFKILFFRKKAKNTSIEISESTHLIISQTTNS